MMVKLMYQFDWGKDVQIAGKSLFLDVPVKMSPKEISV